MDSFPLTDPSLALLASMPLRASDPNSPPRPVAPVALTLSSLPGLSLALPPPLLALLVRAQPLIHALATVSRTLRWSHPRGHYPSWLLLFAWSAICLFSQPLLRLGAPNLALALALVLGYLRALNGRAPKTTKPPRPSVTPSDLASTLESFQVLVDHSFLLHTSLQPIYNLTHWADAERSRACLCASLTSLPFTLLLTHFLGLNIIFLVAGSLVILWSAPWFRLARRLAVRSRLLRLLWRITFRLCFCAGAGLRDELRRGAHHGQSVSLWSIFNPVPWPIETPDDKSHLAHNEALDHGISQQGLDRQEIEIRFTIFENQRWWMGLDWTPNLLPHERANWTDVNLIPVPGPSDFRLPGPTTMLEADGEVQRVVEWQWLDRDWSVCKASPGIGSPSLPPTPASPLSKAHGRAVGAAIIPSCGGTCTITLNQLWPDQDEAKPIDVLPVRESLVGSGLSPHVVEGEDPNLPWDVDTSGWQYGDNHWEKLSRKAGMGRFTRRRAWVRRALLVSRLEPVKENEEHGIVDTPESGRSTGRAPVGITKAIKRS